MSRPLNKRLINLIFSNPLRLSFIVYLYMAEPPLVNLLYSTMCLSNEMIFVSKVNKQGI